MEFCCVGNIVYVWHQWVDWLCVCSEQVHAVSSKEKAEEKEQANKMRVALEVQMDQLRDAHQKQVAALRDEIMEKQASISELKE